jgi:hypothetical protein
MPHCGDNFVVPALAEYQSIRAASIRATAGAAAVIAKKRRGSTAHMRCFRSTRWHRTLWSRHRGGRQHNQPQLTHHLLAIRIENWTARVALATVLPPPVSGTQHELVDNVTTVLLVTSVVRNRVDVPCFGSIRSRLPTWHQKPITVRTSLGAGLLRSCSRDELQV